MRFLYTLLLYLLSPYVFLRLYFKGRRNPDYRKRIRERFLWGMHEQTPVDVWVHAVSMGEVVAAKALVEHHLGQQKKVLVTTMTPTGSSQVVRLFGDRVMHQYLPYDYPSIVKRFFYLYAPKLCIIMETELWPNLLAYAKREGRKLYLANGRISDKAYPSYLRVRWFFKPLLKTFDGIYTQSKLDAERFMALGAPKDKVAVLGNMKCDIVLTKAVSDPLVHLKALWGSARPVVIAASTHPGEEALLLAEFKKLQEAIADVVLLIAPRHPERFDAVFELAKGYKLALGRRSDEASITPNAEVIILDSLGELVGFYGLSDYAFVGGSLVSIGGHNVLEPIALEVPVVCGQYMQNSQSLCDELVQQEAMVQADTAASVMQAIIDWHQSADKKTHQIQNANQVLKLSQGAVARHIECM